MLRRTLPAIILTGDISTATLRNIAANGCLQLNKPVKAAELMDVIRRCLPPAPSAAHTASVATDTDTAHPLVLVVDDDAHARDLIRRVLEARGWRVETFASAEAYLDHRHPRADACLLIDVSLPGMGGIDLLRQLHATAERLPTVMITGDSDVATAVSAMRAGAADFIEKPIKQVELIAAIERALEQARDGGKVVAWRADAAERIASLTARQREIMEAVLAGQPNKNIAADLKISRRTVENHRAEIMRRTGSSSLPGLARLALAAAEHAVPSPIDAAAGPQAGDGR
jgi:two-component system, chemotaxis family, CheB/CheR fusion protein